MPSPRVRYLCRSGHGQQGANWDNDGVGASWHKCNYGTYVAYERFLIWREDSRRKYDGVSNNARRDWMAGSHLHSKAKWAVMMGILENLPDLDCVDIVLNRLSH
jgi:hypothetical protein